MTLGLSPGAVELRAAHDAWLREYQAEKAVLMEAIGAYVRDIQHVGSTAIRGVPAKPILDILIGVDDYERARVCVEPMVRLGYTCRGEYGIPRRHYFVKGDPRTHHVHMVEIASEPWKTTIAFRDLLRSRPDAAREYAAAKLRLAATFRTDRSVYQREKDRVIEALLARLR